MLIKPEMEWIGKALAIENHMEEKRKWPLYSKFIHLLFVSWRCPLCKIERQNRKVMK